MGESMRVRTWSLALLCLVGCEEDPPQEAVVDAATGQDAELADMAPRPDADGPDAPLVDAAPPPVDQGPDVFLPDEGSDVGPRPDLGEPDLGEPDMGACTPAAEACNAADDDCDTAIDEDVANAACYTGPAGTVGVGICRGGEARCQVGALGPCLGQVTPAAAEVCGNLLDDNCDGATDEGCGCAPGAVLACGSDVGACQPGVQRCVDGAFGACEGATEPAAEVCDGEDNDCNGETDEISQACYDGGPGTEGVGQCRGGLQRCVGNGLGACEGQVMPENVDECNGEDDDCDGVVDEDHRDGDTACGMGACAAAGRLTCMNGQLVDTCQPRMPAADLCDGADNDCDGRLDEAHMVMPTNCGMGACAGQGQRVCENGAVRDTCMARMPADEQQNAADDDCDARIDEGFAYTTPELQARFNQFCGGCHGGSGGLTLRNAFEANTVNVPAVGAAGIDRIEPGDPERSYLFHKLRGTQRNVGGGGGRMPTGGPNWADWELERFRLWILAR
jgi:hypothetical protein